MKESIENKIKPNEKESIEQRMEKVLERYRELNKIYVEKGPENMTTEELEEFVGYFKSPFSTGLNAAADSLLFGYKDEIASRIESMTGGRPYDEGQADRQVRRDLEYRQNPDSADIGGVVGTVGSVFIPGGGPARLAKLASKAPKIFQKGVIPAAGRGTVYGTAYGSGTARPGERLEGAGRGAVWGTAVGGSHRAGKALLNKLRGAPKTVEPKTGGIREHSTRSQLLGTPEPGKAKPLGWNHPSRNVPVQAQFTGPGPNAPVKTPDSSSGFLPQVKNELINRGKNFVRGRTTGENTSKDLASATADVALGNLKNMAGMNAGGLMAQQGIYKLARAPISWFIETLKKLWPNRKQIKQIEQEAARNPDINRKALLEKHGVPGDVISAMTRNAMELGTRIEEQFNY